MSGPSITSWSRLEPRPRSEAIARTLAAQVRDPLWILTRQWQFGEFQGEDAASPAWVQLNARFSDITGWTPSGGAPTAYQRRAAPLEAVVESEPFSPDDATAVELGQRFEAMLLRAYADAPAALPVPVAELVRLFREAYPFGARPIDPRDRRAQAFRRVCDGRAIDGCALFLAVRNVDVPPDPAIAEAAVRDIVTTTIVAWRGWVLSVFGEPGTGAPPAWQPERLEYGIAVSAHTPDGARVTLAAHPDREGGFSWYAFDQRAVSDVDPEAAGRAITRNLLPMAVRFRGMPNTRWWQFQDRITDLGEIKPDVSELAKLVLMDFMFVHGNDWFVVPFPQEVGTLCRIDRLLVHDVFGGRTLIDRADRRADATSRTTRRWSMFTTSAPDTVEGFADYFVLAPTAGAAMMSGEALETVRFIRDEMANMVWAVESSTENGLGQPWPGRERTRREPTRAAPGAPLATTALRYRIASSVPENWIPFVPVRISPAGEVVLERAVQLGPAPGEPGAPPAIHAAGRILSPPDPYQIREEEVSRGGVTVSRIVRRARWIDGSTHLWIARRKQAGRGEGSSGLRFDQIEKPPA
jgi:hypothetical protein